MKNFHCKKCNNKPFDTIHALRKHQWTEHRDSYKNMKGPGKWSVAQRKKFKISLAARKEARKELVRLEPILTNGFKKEMTAAQLLTKLIQQKQFMNDVVQLVEGLIRQS